MEKFKMAEFMKEYSNLLENCRETFQALIRNTGIQLDTTAFENTAVDVTDKLHIVFVGQYSSGKSSLIKMLTKNDGIEVGAGITTQNYTPYEWNGLEIIDTPGIQTGIREDHDAITEEAIKKADLIIFVITNELFNPTILRYFNKLAYDMGKAKQMILVVNKMARGGDREVLLSDLQQVLSQPYGQHRLFTLDDFHPSFVDAASYLEAATIDDEELKQELINISHYEEFVDTLNSFAEKRGLYGKIITQVQNTQYALQDIAESVQQTTEGKKNNQELNDLLYSLRALKRTQIRALKNLYYETKQNIRHEGSDLAFNLNVDSQDNIQQQIMEASEHVEQQIHQLEKEREEIISTITEQTQQLGEEITAEVEAQKQALVYQSNTAELATINAVSQQLAPKDIQSFTTQALGRINSEAFNTMLTAGLEKYVFNSWWDKLPIIGSGPAKAANLSSKIIPVLGTAISFVGAFAQKLAEDTRQNEIQQAKTEIREQFRNVGAQVYDQGMQDVENISSGLDKFVNEIEHRLFAEKSQSAMNEQVQNAIMPLLNQCENLLAELEGAE